LVRGPVWFFSGGFGHPPASDSRALTVTGKHVAVVLLGLISGLIFWGQDLRIGVRIRAFDMGLLVVACIFAWHALSRGVLRHTAPFVLSFGAYVIYLACNALLQTSADTAVKELVQMLLFGTFFLALAQFLDDRRSMSVFLAVMLVTLWALALHNAYAHVSQGAYAGWKTSATRN
jgi:hypothetical protein